MSASLPSAVAPFIGTGSALRFHEVLDDNCDPHVSKRDFVLIAPVSDYSRDGYYLLADWHGTPCIHMCTLAGMRPEFKVRLGKTNPLYRGKSDSYVYDEIISFAEFQERVLGKVVMTCKIRDSSLLPQCGQDLRS